MTSNRVLVKFFGIGNHAAVLAMTMLLQASFSQL